MHELKEKFEKVCTIKDMAIDLVCEQLSGDISTVDAAELGEVTDIAKDMAELMKLYCEAEYYYTVTEAMHKSSDVEQEHYMSKYIPSWQNRMHYSSMKDNARSDYMNDDGYDINVKMDKLKRYIDGVEDEVIETLSAGNVSTDEKAYVKQAFTKFISQM